MPQYIILEENRTALMELNPKEIERILNLTDIIEIVGMPRNNVSVVIVIPKGTLVKKSDLKNNTFTPESFGGSYGQKYSQ